MKESNQLRAEKVHEAGKLTLHYALIQGAFWMGYMAIRAYTTQYLADRGLSYTIIGVLYAIASIGSVLLQTGLSGIIDRSKKIRLQPVTLTLIGIVLALGGSLLFFQYMGVNQPILVAILYAIMLIILYALQSFITSLCYVFINHGIPVNFGLARGVGSICAALINVIMGNLVVIFGSGCIFYTLLGFFVILVILVVTFRIRGYHVHSHKPIEFHLRTGDTSHSQTTHKKHQGGTLSFMRKHKNFVLFLIGCFFSMTAYQCVNSYMINIATDVGGSAKTVGYTLAIAASMELPAMVSFNWLQKKLTATRLLRVAGIGFILKVLLMTLAKSEGMMYIAAMMQSVSFGIFLPASTYFANDCVDAEDRVKAQALISAATVGMAMTIGSLIGGAIIDHFGIKALLWLCVGFAAIGCVITFYVTHIYDRRKKIKSKARFTA
ncbi:MAG: MFS transporter [Lachnospiraceae bacterium]|nr:MFS transporter [Lachnospiraceae bacterium]